VGRTAYLPGTVERAAEIYQQALKFEFDERLLPLLGMAYNGLGEVRRIQGQLDEAAQLLEKGIPLCQQWEEIAAMDGYISLARTRRRRGTSALRTRSCRKHRNWPASLIPTYWTICSWNTPGPPVDCTGSCG